MEVIQASWKTFCLVFILAQSSVTGRRDSSIVGLQKKGRLCAQACVFTPFILLTSDDAWKYLSSTEPVCSRQDCENQQPCFSLPVYRVGIGAVVQCASDSINLFIYIPNIQMRSMKLVFGLTFFLLLPSEPGPAQETKSSI